MSTELSPKRLELAKQVVPAASRMVYLHNPNQGQTGLELTQKAAASLGVTVRAVEVRSPKELGARSPRSRRIGPTYCSSTPTPSP